MDRLKSIMLQKFPIIPSGYSAFSDLLFQNYVHNCYDSPNYDHNLLTI